MVDARMDLWKRPVVGVRHMHEGSIAGGSDGHQTRPRLFPKRLGVDHRSERATHQSLHCAVSVPHAPTGHRPKLLDQVREAIRMRHYSVRTEEAYVGWIKRFILFHGKRHSLEMGKDEITHFLSALAVYGHVSASTQNQALCALVFLYRHVLGQSHGSIHTRTANGAGSGSSRPHRSAWTRDLVSAGDIICMNRFSNELSKRPRAT